MRTVLGVMGLLGVALAQAAEPSTPYGRNPAAGHYAEVNGIRLHYESYGKGTPLVMLHGNGGDISALRFQIEHFKARHWVIAVDSRGHGQSSLGSEPLTFERIADDVAALLLQLHAGKADILGWSDGGIVALELAIRHPDQVRRIALSGANLVPEALKPEDLAEMRRDLAEDDAKIAAGDRSQPLARQRQYVLLDLFHPHITAAQLGAIRIPALVMAGEHDMIPEAHTRQIAAEIPGAKLHVFAGAGHGALMEVPEAFNGVVEAFLDAP